MKEIKASNKKEKVQKEEEPILDYKTWVKQQFLPRYNPCASGSWCYNQGDGCEYDHHKMPSEEAYYESKKFNRLASEKVRLNHKFLFDYNDKYLGKLCVDKTTEEYTQALKRYQYLTHIFRDHHRDDYATSCSVVARQQCKKMGYYKEEEDPKCTQKTKRIKKLQKLRTDESFLDQLLGFGKHKQKTWRHVEKYNPSYIDGYIIKQFRQEHPARDIAEAIVARRKKPTK